ncbi:hypothetical protein HMI54_008946 [Coelomomyces lativittatus]|nr:hypothetical protein HMI56_003934 [Coelomomyces lativittatus]KAJ1514417.1 hypothetical protein HMI55_004679 [Coelomomyces lativittatus]KAJ1516565.1 hypothetical protein HMI54_008946 [Coelomomyces lativittatus]
MQSEQRESVEVSPHLSESSGAILRSDSRILNDTIPRAAPSSFRKKSNSNGKLFLVFLFLLLLTSIALIITYFVAIPVHITKKFQKDQFNLEFLQLKEFNLLPNNDTHLLLKTQLKIPRVYYRNELVQVNAVSGFSGLFIIVVKPAAVQEMQTLSNDQAVVAEVDFQVKFKSPEFFQRIALAFIASQNGLPYTVGTLYFQFLSTFSAGNFFKYENFPAFRVVNLTGQSLKTFVSEST